MAKILIRLFRAISWLTAGLLIIFIVPSLLHMGFWTFAERPESWRHANWGSAGILPPASQEDSAKIYVFSARTGGLKGAFSTHTWIVLKPKGQQNYDRYDVVGWGRPLRKNAYDADAYWYSNRPMIDHEISGKRAELLIPLVEQAIIDYPWQNRGDYVIWPGPNSNSFVASILRQVPGIATTTPSTAVGRDFPVEGKWYGRRQNGSLFATLGGYFGLVIGGDTGFELNFLGLVAGFNPMTGEILIPSFGAIPL